MRFNDQDKQRIEARVAAFEQATGTQVVVSVVDRCDSYPEVPWRAFALGVVLAALCVWAMPLSGAVLQYSTVLMLVVVLGAGASLALAAIYFPVTARWMLPVQRREAEVRQYAQAVFLTRELFATRERSAILILIGLYERCVVVIADRGLNERLEASQLEAAKGLLVAALAGGQLAKGVEQALTALQAALLRDDRIARANEIPDDIIRERGH